MVPKRALNVMEGEVDQLLLLTKQAIIPVPYIVPRKVSLQVYLLKVNFEGKSSNLKVDNAKGWLLFNVHVVVMIILTDII